MNTIYFVHFVAFLIIIQYCVFIIKTGLSRQKSGIKAPATSGDEMFERVYRVQTNTLEQLPIVLPLMYICSEVYRADIAAIFGIFFLVGRELYAWNYVKDPTKRGSGFVIGFLGSVSMMACCIYGLVNSLF